MDKLLRVVMAGAAIYGAVKVIRKNVSIIQRNMQGVTGPPYITEALFSRPLWGMCYGR